MKNLVTALVAAKANFAPILKDSVNPHFKNQYASLDGILSAVEPALLEQGLAIVQATDLVGDRMVLSTQLWHISGECLSSIYPLPDASDPQKLGSALTYARRYAVCAMLSVTADKDDDGNSASVKSQTQKHPATQAAKPALQKPAQAGSKPVISPAQIGHLTKVATESGYTLDGLRELVFEYGFETRKAITREVFDKLLAEAGDTEIAAAFNQKAIEEMEAEEAA